MLHHACLSLLRIAVFSVTVFYDERIVVVAEQRPDASEEDSFQWMSRVLQVRAAWAGGRFLFLMGWWHPFKKHPVYYHLQI